MEWFNQHLLSVVVLFPILYSFFILVVPASLIKSSALFGSLVAFLMSLMLWGGYHPIGPE
jgi:NADH:ubiquinone oxidoreductase subunit 4 (subunit M)